MESEVRSRRLAALLERGVAMPAPEQVHLGAEVDLERISSSATLHPGTPWYPDADTDTRTKRYQG